MSSTEDAVQRIVDAFNCDTEVRISEAYADGGIDPLFPRLSRAAINQVGGEAATISRYAIWANTVRDNLIEALSKMDSHNSEDARRLITRAVNALSAFAEIQALIDQEGR